MREKIAGSGVKWKDNISISIKIKKSSWLRNLFADDLPHVYCANPRGNRDSADEFSRSMSTIETELSKHRSSRLVDPRCSPPFKQRRVVSTSPNSGDSSGCPSLPKFLLAKSQYAEQVVRHRRSSTWHRCMGMNSKLNSGPVNLRCIRSHSPGPTG